MILSYFRIEKRIPEFFCYTKKSDAKVFVLKDYV